MAPFSTAPAVSVDTLYRSLPVRIVTGDAYLTRMEHTALYTHIQREIEGFDPRVADSIDHVTITVEAFDDHVEATLCYITAHNVTTSTVVEFDTKSHRWWRV